MSFPFTLKSTLSQIENFLDTCESDLHSAKRSHLKSIKQNLEIIFPPNDFDQTDWDLESIITFCINKQSRLFEFVLRIREQPEPLSSRQTKDIERLLSEIGTLNEIQGATLQLLQ